MHKDFWDNVHELVQQDATKQLQVECLLIGWELYEWDLVPEASELKNGVWTGLFKNREDGKTFSKNLIAERVAGADWNFGSETLRSIRKDKRIYFTLRSTCLRRSYLENEVIEWLFEGLPDWKLVLRFELNHLPKIRCEVVHPN